MHHVWDNVHMFDAEAQKCRSTYRQAWSALQHLSVDPEYLVTLHKITDANLKWQATLQIREGWDRGWTHYPGSGGLGS